MSLWTGAQSSSFGMTAFEIAEQSSDCFVIATYMTALESTLLYFSELRTQANNYNFEVIIVELHASATP